MGWGRRRSFPPERTRPPSQGARAEFADLDVAERHRLAVILQADHPAWERTEQRHRCELRRGHPLAPRVVPERDIGGERAVHPLADAAVLDAQQIGSAACRERVWQYV